MAIIGSAYVEIRALDNNLQRDIDKAMKKVKEPIITLQSNVNLQPVRDKIRVLREELRRNPLKFSAEVDLDRVHEHIDATYELYKANPLEIETNVNREPAERALESIRREYGDTTSTINTNADTAAAEAQIGFAARNRRARIDVAGKIDPEFQKAFKGLFYTLTGALPADKIKGVFVGLASNLEMAAISAGKLLTVVGSIGAEALTASANILTLGGDVADLIGFAALAPAVISGIGAGIAATVLGWKGFGDALSSDAKKSAKAMALLPPEAQKAAESLKGLGGQIRKTTQAAYWKQMGDSIQRLHRDFFPKLEKGLEGTGAAMGKWGQQFARALEVSASDGSLERLFQGINKGLDNASKAVQPFTRGLFHLGAAGSKYLEAMGTSLAKMGARFDNWVTKSINSGAFDRWVAQAKAAAIDLGHVWTATTDIFKGLTKASRISGGKGLTEFANGMQSIAKLVNSEPFQSKLITILEGARRGAESLGKGFAAIKKLVGDSTVAISGFLSLAGQIGGSFLKNFTTIFDNTGFGDGMIKGLYGFKKAMDELKPAFEDLGTVLGDLGEISGTLFQEMAPGLNNLMDTVQKVIAAVKDGVIAAMPVFNDFVQNILQVMAPIVIGIAEAFGNLLKSFSDLPGGLQNVIMAFGLFLLLKPKLDKFFTSMGYRMDRWNASIGNTLQRSQGFRTQMSDNFRYAGASAGYAASAIGKSLGNVRDSFRITGMIAGDSLRTTFGQLKSKYGSSVSEFGAGVKNGFKQAFTISPDLKAGFQRDIKEPFQAVGKGIAGVGRAISGEMRMVADHTKAYFSQLPSQAKKTWQNLPQIAKEEFTGVKNTIGYHMGEAADKVRDRSIYASKHLHDMGSGIKNAVNDVKAGSAAMGDHIRAMVSPAESGVMRAGQSVAKSYNGMVLAGTMSATVLSNKVKPIFEKIGQSAQRVFEPISTAASTAYGKVSDVASRIGQTAQRSFDSISSAASSAYGKATDASSRAGQAIKDHASRAGQAVATGYNNMVLASTVAGTAMGRQMGDAATRIGTKIGEAATTVGRHASSISSAFGRTFSSIGTASTTAASTIGNAFKSAVTNVRNNFTPVGAAVRETFSTIGTNLRPAVTAVGELGTAAGGALKNMGAAAGAGLRGAATGLLGALGGPWGLAITGAAVAIGAIGQNAADSKAEVEKLASMMDQQTGRMTGASTLEATKKLFDGNTNNWDDFFRTNIRGSDRVTEVLDKLGISTQKYTEKMLDPKGRDAFIKGTGDLATALRYAQPITDEMAASIGKNKDELENLSWDDSKKLANDLDWVKDKASGMGQQIDAAQKIITDTAKATGVNNAQAAILAKNYDTLALSTSSASDKLSALKENLQILSSETEKKQLGEKGYQQTLRDTAKGIQAVRDENNGLVTNLFDVKKGFDFTKQAGADLHTTLQNQTDGILQIGVAALDKATKAGAGADAANKAATDAMAKPIADLKQNLRDIGFSEPQIKGIIDTMNLMPKDLEAAISVKGGEEARKEINLTKLATESFASGNYVATLSALPAAAKTAIEEATGLAGAFANHDWQTILTALDQTGPGKEAVLASLLTVTDGNFAADLKANDVTKPAVDAANKTMAGLTPPPPVMLQAKDATAKPVSSFQGVLARLSTTTASPVITVTDRASGQVAKIQQAVTNIKGAAPKITITDLATGKVATIDGKIQGLKGKTPTVSISDHATSPIQSIKGWLDTLRDKTFTVTTVQNTVHRDSGKGADGGIVRSMSNMFGGSLSLARVKAFANGGVEKHVAQISAGQTPYRIWSEPETGGEAYIPLSKAKRSRSTKILEEVARMFGMTLLKTKSFANGGVEGGSSSAGSSAGSLSTSHVSAAMITSIAKEMMKDNTNLNKIGEYVVDGIIGGVNNKSGDAVTAMTGVAGSLEDAVRKRLEIHSPSKTFLGLGKHIVDGLVVGIADKTPAVQKRIATLANQIYVAASDISKATGKSIGSSMSLLNHQKALNKGWNKIPVWKYADQIYTYYKKTGKTGNATLADIVRAREDVNVRLDAANKRLKDLQTARADVFKSVSSQVRGEYKLGSNIIGDTKPYIPKTKFSDVMNYTAGMAARLRSFNSKIAALKKKGVAPALIQEIAMLGSVEGISMADAVLSGTNAEVKNLNAQYAQVGAMSNAIGNTTADAMYKVGIDAQAGLVRGLQAESKGLTAAANKLTNTLIAQVKKNLGIRSPSRVFAQLGRFTGEGFVMGLDQMQPSLDKRVDNFINLDPRKISTAPSTNTTAATSSSPLADKSITVNVHPSPGMDERAVGQAAIKEIGWQILSS